VCFSAIKEVLGKTGVHARQIGVVIVNCSLFNPTPSLSAMIMNKFGMGSSTINYNLGGMGCSGARRRGPCCWGGGRGSRPAASCRGRGNRTGRLDSAEAEAAFLARRRRAPLKTAARTALTAPTATTHPPTPQPA
jgi:hypothetical protein